MDQLIQKMFGPDMLWLAFIQLELATICFGYFVLLIYRQFVTDSPPPTQSLEESHRLVLGHMDRIVGEYFYKELEAFEFRHALSISDYTTPELLALCEQKGWTNEIFYSLLLVDYNEFNHE